MRKITTAIPIKQGDKYGFFTLTGNDEVRTDKCVRYVEAICICGNKEFRRFAGLRSGHTKSCGCKKKELNSKASTTHGLTRNFKSHPIYRAWQAMKSRCYRKNNIRYKYYGGRGLGVYSGWKNNPKAFYDWSIKNGWEDGLTIERKNNNKGYYPSNCKWANSSEQSRNTSRNIFLTAFGETKCIEDWVNYKRCSIKRSGLIKRLKKGMKVELAITKPADVRYIRSKK